ncbi:O-antigen polymerase [Marinobacterium lutimaris]|uniref:Oligosaccharide repeat unit polymerase n=1 Tax=Marinobacterium lutimaris TaxID=568106 RepID=A0A1H6BBD7_9GAMM|nr:O-antigen polymerase [Marinobacterium lutimaris]SEG57496.1 oligosaccharide repeat unit polymerase [Marinobacterium lutimaris]
MNYFYSRPGFAFFMGFVFPYLLTKIEFVYTVGNISEKTESLILIAVLAFFVGLVSCYLLWLLKNCFFRTKSVPVSQVRLVHRPILLWGLFSWFFLACACLFYEFYLLGGIPILSKDVESLRFSMQVNGYVHLLAISLGIVSSLLIVTASFDQGLVRIQVFLVGLFGFFLLSLTGNRSDFMLMLAILCIFFVLNRDRMISLKWTIAGCVFISAFVLMKFYREIAFGVDYMGMIDEQLIGEPSAIKYAVYPLYLTLTYGFMVFDWLVEAGLDGLEGGRYTFYAFYSLLPGHQMDFGTYKNQMLGIDFYAELTSTFVSNFYVDFGAFGVFLGSFSLAVLLGAVYRKAKMDRRFTLLYSILYLYTLIFFYVYIYVYFISFVAIGAFAFYCVFFLRRSVPDEASYAEN